MPVSQKTPPKARRGREPAVESRPAEQSAPAPARVWPRFLKLQVYAAYLAGDGEELKHYLDSRIGFNCVTRQIIRYYDPPRGQIAQEDIGVLPAGLACVTVNLDGEYGGLYVGNEADIAELEAAANAAEAAVLKAEAMIANV